VVVLGGEDNRDLSVIKYALTGVLLTSTYHTSLRERSGTMTALSFALPHPTDANYFTVELTVLKEMSQALADLFGLRLPVSCKKQANQVAEHQLEERPALSI